MGDQPKTIEGKPVTLPVVSNKVPFTYETDDFIFVVSSFILFSGFFVLSIYGVIPLIFFVIVIILATDSSHRIHQAARRLFRDYVKPKNYIGQASFLSDSINAVSSEKNFTIPLKDIKAIYIESNQFQGAGNFRNSKKGYGGLDFSGLNRLRIILNDNTEERITCLIPDETHLENMVIVLENWYKQGIKVKEVSPVGTHKLILFRFDWSYEELQELKKRLKVDSFYN